jgi:hypothetical protein
MGTEPDAIGVAISIGTAAILSAHDDGVPFVVKRDVTDDTIVEPENRNPGTR